MGKEKLKKNLIERIQHIDDMNILNAIQAILNTLESERVSSHNVNTNMETEDFSGYIKEWLKSM